jgi:hypothetical protein
MYLHVKAQHPHVACRKKQEAGAVGQAVVDRVGSTIFHAYPTTSLTRV